MKTLYQLILILITIVISQSCEKEIEFDSKDIAPKIVVNGFIQQDSLISITVGTSKAIPGVDKPNVWINDATVKLFVDGEEKETLTAYNILTDTINHYYMYPDKPLTGYRSLTTKAETGKTYKLEVSHPNFETVTCETNIPVPIKVESIDTITKINENNGYSSSDMQVKIKFRDTPAQKNYYRLVYKTLTGIAMSNNSYQGDTTYKIIVYSNIVGTYISSDDPIINPSSEDANDFLFGGPTNTFNLFSDDFIDGKEYELSFYLNSNYYYYNTNISKTFVGEFFKLNVELQSITREAYLYMKSVTASNFYNDDFLSEKVPIFTNVENGIGIFAGYSSSSKSVSRGEYPIDGIEYQIQENGGYYITYE